MEQSIAADTERIRALERVIERLYSDVTTGRISEYTREQAVVDHVNAGQEVFLIEAEIAKTARLL